MCGDAVGMVSILDPRIDRGQIFSFNVIFRIQIEASEACFVLSV